MACIRGTLMPPIGANPGVGTGVAICVGIGEAWFDGPANTVGALRPVSALPHPTSPMTATRPTSNRPNAVRPLANRLSPERSSCQLLGLLDQALWPLPPLYPDPVRNYPNSNAER